MLQSHFSEPVASPQQIVQSPDHLHAIPTMVALTEMAAVAVSTYLAFVAYHLTVLGVLPNAISYGWICTQLALTYGLICLADRQYDFPGTEWNRQAPHRGALALTLAFVFLLALMFITGTVSGYSRGTLLAQLAIALPTQIVVRAVLLRAIEIGRKRGYRASPGVVVLAFPGLEKPIQLIEQLSSRKEDVRQIYRLQSTNIRSQLRTILRENRTSLDSVLLLFHSDNMDAVTRVVDMLSEMPVRIKLLPVGMLDFMCCSRIGCFGHARVFEIAPGPDWVIDRFLKRSFDLLVAGAAGLLLLSPMLIVAALIKLDSQGPVLFRQTRHGYNNKPIRVLKFRTMVMSRESVPRQATRNDPRVTRVGRILRQTNIDELPQLFNVIRGDMSIVGPRPHAVWHNQMFEGQIARLSRRHNVKPGITGWAQVNGLRGETDLKKMRARVEHDLHYINNWSLALDVRITLMTIFSRKSYENAY